MESRIGLEIIEVVEQAAIASAKLTGKGDKDGADEAAVEAMRERMNKIDMRGRIVIGEGERDDAPMLFIGEEVGTGHKTGTGPEIDIRLMLCSHLQSENNKISRRDKICKCPAVLCH